MVFLALAGFEARIGLVYNIQPALAADHPAVLVALLGGFQGAQYFHRSALLFAIKARVSKPCISVSQATEPCLALPFVKKKSAVWEITAYLQDSRSIMVQNPFRRLLSLFMPSKRRTLEEAPQPWLEHYPDGIDWPFTPPSAPLPSILAEAANDWPERTAIDFLGRSTSFAELQSQVEKAAAGFQALGIGKGDRIGLFLPNCPQFIISYYGALKAGATVVNFNPLLADEEIEQQLIDAKCQTVVTLALDLLYPKLPPMMQSTPLKRIIVGTLSEALPFPKNILFPILEPKKVVRPEKDDHHMTFQSLLEMGTDFIPPVIRPEKDVAVLQYTGGTTGTPKGAALTHSNLMANTQQVGKWFTGLEEGGESLLGVLPLFHVFAMTAVMNLAIHKGMTLILHPRFNLKNLLVDVTKKQPTLLMGVPTMFTAINQSETLGKYDLSSLKFCISGGAALPLDVKKRFEELSGCTLVEGYGLTECSPVAAVNPLFGEQKAGSIGLPLPGTKISIQDPDNPGRFVPLGDKGEICISGPQVMQGYWKKPEENSAVLADGWLHTGDIGTMDEDGYTFVVDRKKELILSGGYNIYPRHVEEALYDHPEVVECAVIGVADDYLGQTVKAFVVLREEADESEESLIAFLGPKIAKYALPRAIEFRKELPKSLIGKILKKELQ